MCYSPIKLKNPTKNIYAHGGQPLVLHVPCGKCVECIQNKRDEWSFRSYVETRHTIDHGGYIYYDTLTYSDEFLPHIHDFVDIKKYGINDFTCFNRDHIRYFFKRLRSLLKYHCGTSFIKYFLTSEYGTDPRFTRRPHYHIGFYVTSGVHPLTLSKLVNQAWHYGRTEGIDWKPLEHVAYNTFGYDLGFGNRNTKGDILKAARYISKYITKNSTFIDRYKHALECIENFIPLDDTEDLLKQNDALLVKRTADCFHRQSQGFGISYLDTTDEREQEYLAKDLVLMCDNDTIVNVLPLSTYFKRKLYYEQKKRKDGTLYWEKTPAGIAHDKAVIVERVQNAVKTLQKQIATIPQEYKIKAFTLLGDRTLEDLAIYNLYYYGRHRDSDSLTNPLSTFKSFAYDLTNTEYCLDDWCDRIAQSSLVNSMTTDIYPVDDKRIVDINGYLYTYDNYIELHTINQNTCAAFQHFDDIMRIINSYRIYQGQLAKSAFDLAEHLHELHKNYY